jgi:tRNA 2-thiocytidine biosynthesis protein TtcA
MDRQLIDFAGLQASGVADANGDTAFDQEAFPDMPADWQAQERDETAPDMGGAAAADDAAAPTSSTARPRRVVMMSDLR